MNYLYNRGALLIVVLNLCVGIFSYAQKNITDSAANKKKPLIDVAYGKQPEWMVTGSITTVKGSAVQPSFGTSFPTKLLGRVPGLTAQQNTAEPGFETTSLFSRGLNTFGVGGTDMLILVDGAESSISDLTAEEVESITLLKDASALAMYGSRAANGVLLVTTKRGEEGKLNVVFSTQQGRQSAIRLPQYLGSYDYASLYNEALVNDGKPILYSASDLESYRNGNDPFFHPDVNWYNQVLRKSVPISDYNLNFSGGNNTIRYFLLLNEEKSNNLYRQTGKESPFSINGSYQRVNFRLNADLNLTKRLSASVSIGGTVVYQTNPAANNTDDIFNLMAIIPPNAFSVYNPNGSFGRNSLYSNPLGDILNKGFFTSNGRTLQTTFGLTEQLDMIAKGLSINAKVSFNSYFLSQSNKSRTYESFAISKDISGNIVYDKYGINKSLVASEGASDQHRNFVFQTSLNYDRSFGVHSVNAVLLYNADDYTISGNAFPAKHVNLSGRTTYAYNQKYIGEFSFSYMGSENFPKNQRYGFFPAASLGWILSNEDFLKTSKIINHLKIRASYGMVGNDKIGGPAFMFEQYYPYTSSYYFGTNNNGFGSIVQGSPANENVTWEKEKILNFGLEATLADHFNFTLDVFNRDRYDILVQPNGTIPDFMGFTKPYLNQGKANNKGFETTLRYNNSKTQKLQFFIEASLWAYKNRIVYNSEALQSYDYLYQSGRMIGQTFGLVALGFFKDQADINSSPKQIWTTVKPGDVKYKDQNGDGKIDQSDYYPIGNTNLPNLTAGLNIGASYKGFDFTAFFQGVTGRTVYLSGLNFQAFQNNGKAGTIALNRWTAATAATATYPRLSSGNDDNNYRYSTLWQRDGSFIKLRTIELGYTLSTHLTKLIKLQETRIFVNGNNLFSLDHMNGYIDPEVTTSYPATKSYSVGLRIQFK